MASYVTGFVNYMWSDPTEINEEAAETQETEITCNIDPETFVDGGFAIGELWRWSGEDNDWVEFLNESGTEAIAGLQEGSAYQTIMSIYRGDGIRLLSVEVNNDLDIRFNDSNHCITFITETAHGVDTGIRFIFTDQDQEQGFKQAYCVRLWETNFQQPFKKLVKNHEDEEYAMGTLEEAEEMDAEPEEEFDEKVEAYTAVEVDGFNKQIEDSFLHNRTYVLRNNPNDVCELGLFEHQNNDLNYLMKVAIKDYEGFELTPEKMLPHRQDAQLLFLTEEHPESVAVMDMTRGEVVEFWNTQSVLKDMTPVTKYEQLTDSQLVKACTANSYFTIDPRTEEKKVAEFRYKKNPYFTSIRSTGQGYTVTGAEDGSLRLYNKPSMRAKTQLPGIGCGVKYLDVTEDGGEILVTYDTKLLLFFTQMPNAEKNGFEVRMGKHKPKPITLRFKTGDMMKNDMGHLAFTEAKFNHGSGGNHSEFQRIVALCKARNNKSYIAMWEGNDIRNGVHNNYVLQEVSEDNVTSCTFRFNHANELLFTEQNQVYTQKTKKRN